MRPCLFFTLAALASVFANVGFGAEQKFRSGGQRVSLLELFTSEGCSSCPPAERWLAALRDAPGLWRDFVPLEFHVNYWDRLGWPDRFASREATDREYAHAAAWSSGSVYTPCFVRDGVEWRTHEKTLETLREKAGELTLVVIDDKTARAEFVPAKFSANETLELHVAILGSGFSTRVTGGENRGETLRHEFVVLTLATNSLSASDHATFTTEFALPRPKIADAPRLAAAAWVTRRNELTPLQATGGWMEKR
jgi:hypothetical protein